MLLHWLCMLVWVDLSSCAYPLSDRPIVSAPVDIQQTAQTLNHKNIFPGNLQPVIDYSPTEAT